MVGSALNDRKARARRQQSKASNITRPPSPSPDLNVERKQRGQRRRQDTARRQEIVHQETPVTRIRQAAPNAPPPDNGIQNETREQIVDRETPVTRTATQNETTTRQQQRRKTKPEDWKNSNAKALLIKLLRDESSWVHAMLVVDPENAYDTVDAIHSENELFQQYPLQNFRTNFKNLKESISKLRDNIEFDQDAFNKEKLRFPRQRMLKAGYPRWNHSEAKLLLEEDIKEGRHRGPGKSPKTLRASRPEYQEFKLERFRERVYSEHRKQTGDAFWVHKRNRKMRKSKVVEEETSAIIMDV